MICRIRAHHGVCLSFFRGKGYNNEFTQNMWAMKEKLEENPEVILLCGVDDVCAHCPNSQEGNCVSGEKAERYDGQVLEHCGLISGTSIRWKEFQKMVREQIIDAGEREKICGDCQWNDICKE